MAACTITVALYETHYYFCAPAIVKSLDRPEGSACVFQNPWHPKVLAHLIHKNRSTEVIYSTALMIYLNVAGLSPFKQAVQQEVTATFEQFSRLLYSDEGIHYYRKTLQRCRQQLAQWLQVEDAQNIAFVPNATTASWLVLSRINWKPGDQVLTTTHENSTVLREILALQTHGVHVHTLDSNSPNELEAEIEHLLVSTHVRAIVISHVSHID